MDRVKWTEDCYTNVRETLAKSIDLKLRKKNAVHQEENIKRDLETARESGK